MKKAGFFLILVLLAVPCAGEIIIVDDEGHGHFDNVQAAINDSNDGDIIYVLPGNYTGSGNRDVNFAGRAVTVTGVDPEDPYIVAATVIDCDANDADRHRGFLFNSGEESNSVLAGLTVTGGYADYGGGIRCDNSSPTIADCVVRDNSALYRGGGIYCYYSDPIIADCAIRDNIKTSSSTGGAYGGGGIYCYRSDPTITDSTISGNSSNTDGGGMYCSSYSVPNIRNSQFVKNTAVRWGGGIYTHYHGPYATACAFNGNTAEYGGGIYTDSVGPNLKSCTLVGNVAAVNGGGLCGTEIGYWLTNCTFSSNIAESGFGGGIRANYVWVRNSILWDNSDSGASIESAQISAPNARVSFSCVQDGDANDANIPFGGADSNNIDDYPTFVRDPNDGGDGWGTGGNDEYGDLHLQSHSPCINAGDPLSWIDPCLVDIDGEPRVMGLVVDMGADEYLTKMLIVTRPEDGEVWTWGSWHEITWDSHIYDQPVFIAYITEGNDMHPIDMDVPNTGSYMWHLPQRVDTNECVIRVAPSVVDMTVVCIDSGVFTIHPDSPGPPVTSKWKSLGGDYDRRGLSENYGPEIGCVKWQFEVDGAISAGVTIGPNDTVYVPCEDGNLYKLDSNGVPLWSYRAGSPLISSPSIGSDGTVYVGDSNGTLYAVDVNGNLRWTHTTDGMLYSSPAVSPDGNNIYVGSEDGRLYALGRDGSELWSFETWGFGELGGSILASPSIGPDGTVYLSGLRDPNLYALDPNDGSIEWVCHFSSEGWPFTSPVVGANGTIYQTLLYDPYLYAIDENDGNILWATNLSEVTTEGEPGFGTWSCSRWYEPDYYEWGWCDLFCEFYTYYNAQYNVGNSCWSEPVLGQDGTIYVSFDDPWLRAVDPNGTIKWIRRIGSSSGFSLTVDSSGVIYAASDDSNLYVVSPDGFEIARFDSNNYWLNFPVVSADNTIIFSDSRDNSMLVSYATNEVWAIGADCAGEEVELYYQGGAQDLYPSGTVDFMDFAILAGDWPKCTDCDPYSLCWQWQLDVQFLAGDINRDFYVDLADVTVITDHWLRGY
ncbi:MAG: outer membrane protein assembly factor BamB family protein [Planctomycetota bacterium]|jgi:predicted outer membrane repeat protein